MNTKPQPLIIEPSSTVTSAVIWMHGLGADAHDFEGIVPMLPTESQGIRMIFPNAPSRPVTINNGYVMPAWYDISDTAFRNNDKQGIAESTATIHALIDEQIEAGIDSKRIIVAGFSQGGAMALHAGLRYPKKLAGIIALSCYVLNNDTHHEEVATENLHTSIWMAHGTTDAVVPYELGKRSAELLEKNSHTITFTDYSMGHEVSMPEIEALANWIYETLE